MKSFNRNLPALTLLFACGQGSAEVIYSGLKEITIPTTYAGIYIDVDGGQPPSASSFSGWDFNPYMGGVYLANNTAFQPGRTVATGMGTLQNFAVNSMIDVGLLLGTGTGGSIDHLGTTFTADTEGYLGFKLNGDDYGWMRVVFTNNTGGALIKDWAYDNSGAAIATGNVLQSGSTVTLNSALGSFTLGSQIGGTNSIVKTGANSTTLTGTNTYSGITTVSEGTLRVNGTISGSGAVTVDSGATVGGTGSVTGALNVSGALAPGASVESFSSGALTMTTGSTFVYEALDSGAMGADLMVANGTLSLTGVTLDLSGASLGLGSWNVGDKLTLISYSGLGITSGFSGYNDGSTYTFDSNQWVFDYNDTLKGNNFASEATGSNFVTLTVVPEPRAALLGGLGLLALLRRRR